MRFLYLFVFLLISAFAFSQTIEDAERLYSNKDYGDAAEIYFKLYHYGKAAEAWEKKIELLENSKVKKNKTKNQKEAEALQQRVEEAERLRRLVEKCEDVQIIDSIVMSKENFLTAYLLSDEAGNLYPNDDITVFENELGDRRYFASKTKDERLELSLQIYNSGIWGESHSLEIPTDGKGDDAYPFVMPDGMTIYFASTGNGSIGGYDIFASRYNTATESYLAPLQLGMPFNSVYNDYMYVIDELTGVGYFATDRFQPEGRVVVYTFIPNETFTPLNGLNENEIADRARIASIHNTWREGQDYSVILAAVRENIENRPIPVKKDFTFVVNDNIVYYTLSDFASDAAKKSYLVVEETAKKIDDLETDLENRRMKYLKSNKEAREKLKNSILASEKTLETLYDTYKTKVKETRNTEIRFLRAKE